MIKLRLATNGMTSRTFNINLFIDLLMLISCLIQISPYLLHYNTDLTLSAVL